MTRIGINGFGRMGRLALRAGWDDPTLAFVRVNEPGCDGAQSAHLLQFDSVHGRWPHDCTGDDQQLSIDGTALAYSRETALDAVDWSDCDIVIEASGKFRDTAKLQGYLDQGVKKVLVSAPVSGARNLVYGVNHHLYDPQSDAIVTAASCTTNCLAPLVQVMQTHLGIRHAAMTTIHDITNTQTIIDKGHKDWRRARACGESLIPTSTGSAKAIVQIFPELEGRIDGLAVRVPLLNASLTDVVFEVEKATDVGTVNKLFRDAAAAGPLKGILGYEERPLVSVDYRTDPRSAIVDALSTRVIDDTQVKVFAWYDNEWGYANRMVDLARLLAASL